MRMSTKYDSSCESEISAREKTILEPTKIDSAYADFDTRHRYLRDG